MTFTFRCPICRSVRKASRTLVGKRVRCADCFNFVQVPSEIELENEIETNDAAMHTDSSQQAAADQTVEEHQPDENESGKSKLPSDKRTPKVEPSSSHDDQDTDQSRRRSQDLRGSDSEYTEMSDDSNSQDPYRQPNDDPYGDDEFNLSPPSEDDQRQADDSIVPLSPSSSGPDAAQGSSDADPESGGSQSLVRWKEEPDDFDTDEEAVSFSDRDRSDRESEMDMTPMVDVTFLLLIFFMVTASFTLQRTIEQPKQTEEEPSTQVADPEDEDPDVILVFIDEYNTFQLIYGDHDWECPSEQELIRRLREVIENPTAGATPTKLTVMAHAECLHERVVMAMDAGTEVGMASVQVTMTETGP